MMDGNQAANFQARQAGALPGELAIQFQTPVELLEKLFALSQALTNDYPTFERSWIAASRQTGGGR